MTLDIQSFDGLLFDLDGTIANSMPIHNQAWLKALEKFQSPMTLEILQEYAGVPTEKTVEIFNERFHWKLDPISVAKVKENFFLENIQFVQPIDSVINIARAFQKKKPLAIVSGGTREMVSQIVDFLGIQELFPIKVCMEDTQFSKPHPAPFLLAAQLLCCDPKNCLAFEDGSAGILAAKAAGMRVMKVESDFTLTPLP